MPNVAVVLREEIQRLARKEVRAAVTPLKKHRAEDRRAIAALKRQVAALERKVAKLEKQAQGTGTKTAKSSAAAAAATTGPEIRFSPKWVASDRARLGLSRKAYGQLVGVTGLTIYNWETGRSRPRAKQLVGWARIRRMGKREALRELDE